MRVISDKFFGKPAAAFFCAVLFICPALGAENNAPLPDLSGLWGRNMTNLEVPLSGAGPIMNVSKTADGTLDNDLPVGDYTNPILTAEGARILKERGELSLGGRAFLTPHNTCWLEPPPFALAMQFGVQILQYEDGVVLNYLLNHLVRHVRINAPHRADMTPSWQGDSVGHYEGDTLVVDTIGIKAGPFATVDRNGTPHSEALHVVERYRLIDGREAREAVLRHERLYNRNAAAHADTDRGTYGRGPIDPDTGLNGLQVAIAVEDQGVFTAPWSALITYRPVTGDWPEAVCAENPRDISGSGMSVPVAERFDF